MSKNKHIILVETLTGAFAVDYKERPEKYLEAGQVAVETAEGDIEIYEILTTAR